MKTNGERKNRQKKKRDCSSDIGGAFFLVSAADSGKPADSKKEQEEAVEMYVREEKREQRENRKKAKKCRSRNRAVQTKICFGQLIFAGLRSKNREICAWLWIPGCALDVPVAHGQDNAYYLTHDAFCGERIYGSILHRVIHRRIFLNVTRFYMGIICGMERCSEELKKSIVKRRGNRNFRICTCICRVKHGSAVFGVWRRRMPKVMFTGWGMERCGLECMGTGRKKQHYLWQR